MKFYAVRNGRQPGIYDTWAECKQQTHGYSGAVFKSFETEEAAALFLQADKEKQPIDNSLPFAYVDGSYSKSNTCYGWGGFMVCDKQRWIFQGKGSEPKFLTERNIAGELIGTLQIVFKCQKMHIKEINVYFDYTGIENYVNGSWKAKTPLAQYYANTVDLLQDDVKLHFINVKGHTGIRGNEFADLLAKEAVGATLRKKDIKALEDFKNGGEGWKQLQ